MSTTIDLHAVANCECGQPARYITADGGVWTSTCALHSELHLQLKEAAYETWRKYEIALENLNTFRRAHGLSPIIPPELPVGNER